MHANDLRIALFSGNYNYVRDGANQALNLLVGHLLSKGATVRVYSPTNARPAFPPTGDLVAVPSLPLPAGRGEYTRARGLPGTKLRPMASAPAVIAAVRPSSLNWSGPLMAAPLVFVNDTVPLYLPVVRFSSRPRW